MLSADDLFDQLRDFQKRLEDLEATSQIGHTSIVDGAVRVYSDTQAVGDTPRMEIGLLDTTNLYGIRVRNSAGVIVFEADELGLRRPVINVPFNKVQLPVLKEPAVDANVALPFGPTGSVAATAHNAWETIIAEPSHSGYGFSAVVNVSTGATAEFRLGFNDPDNPAIDYYTDTITVVGDTAAFPNILFDWEPPWMLNNNVYLVQLEARVDTGLCYIYTPNRNIMAAAPDINADAQGNPRLL